MTAHRITTDEPCDCCDRHHAELLVVSDYGTQIWIAGDQPSPAKPPCAFAFCRWLLCQACYQAITEDPANHHLFEGAKTQ